MSPLFAGLSLIALSVLAWRRGWVTKWRERKPYVRPTQSEDFWIGWSPKPNGQASLAAPIMAEKCQAGCGRNVVFRWLRDDAEGYDLCQSHSDNSAKKLTDLGFDNWPVEREDEACTGG